jgi:hypothetical protein
MRDIDAALARLSQYPTDPRLQQIDAAVLTAVELQRRNGAPLSGAVFGVAAGLALTMGLLGAALPATETANPSIAPFGVPPALAPSTLLGTSE